jgi:hypothetical protein
MPHEYKFRRLRLWAVTTPLIAATALLSIWLLEPSPAGADARVAPQVMIALLPSGTPPEALERFPAIAPGLLSAGIGDVPSEQTYLDVTQGSRIDDDLYDDPLPSVTPTGFRVPRWRRIVERAESAPADLVPGLLAAALKSDGKTIAAAMRLGLPSLLVADRNGRILRAHTGVGTDRCHATVCVREVRASDLRRLLGSTGPEDLLIAIERPPPEPDHQLTIGIAGRGFEGDLTSDSTRLRGYVLSTDIAPTILERLGAAVPSQMSGEPIHSEGSRDIQAVVTLQDRLASIVGRRGPVIGVSALIWIALAAVAVLISRGSQARPAMRMLTLSGIYLPLMLLLGAALQPSEGVERLIVLLGAPLLALLTLAMLPGYRALAFACGLTTLAFAVDVIAGSPLTPLSLIGPDPGLGVRFYGIGNELEATLVPLILVGTGAAITALSPALTPRQAAAVFLIVGLLSAFVFAFGRFGADVGAAIVLPAGAAVAAGALGAARRTVLLAVALPLAALAALALLDLLLGGNAHLTRSVLDAGGFNELGDVAERRLRLSAHSFSRGFDAPLLWVALLGIGVAIWRRRQVLGWFADTPALRAGFLAAVFAIALATLVNDSGVLLLEVGTIYLLLFAGFAWTQAKGPFTQAGTVPQDPESRLLDERSSHLA